MLFVNLLCKIQNTEDSFIPSVENSPLDGGGRNRKKQLTTNAAEHFPKPHLSERLKVISYKS